MRILSIVTAAVLIQLCVSILSASVIHVPADSSTIQAGINGAVDGDTVMIAPGVYCENRIQLLGKAITVMSTNPGDPDVVASTVIDGNGEFGHIIRLDHSNEDTTSIIAGLTIRNGDQSDGGGVYCVNSSPLVRNCLITGNNAEGGYGGGIYCSDSHALFIDCKITHNAAVTSGGGVYVRPDASPTFTNCVISENVSSDGQGGGLSCLGGGLFEHCIVAMNSGGGIEASGGTFHKCQISNNSGSGISCSGGVFSHVLIYGNDAYVGGGLKIWGTDAAFSNCTISNNNTSAGGGAIDYLGESALLENCILWYNSSPEILDEGTDLEVRYCNIDGGWPGEGNINEDPLFVLSDRNDYRLLWRSPCIDTGSPEAIDPDSTRSDMGVHYFDQNDFLTIYLTPDTTEVSPNGHLGVTYTAINRWNLSEHFWLLSEVLLPGGSWLNLLGLNQYRLPASYSIQVHIMHTIPNISPAGMYKYRSMIGMPPGMLYDKDSFRFKVTE